MNEELLVYAARSKGFQYLLSPLSSLWFHDNTMFYARIECCFCLKLYSFSNWVPDVHPPSLQSPATTSST
uniref:Uncharacterized protein n=1 Tax=Hyaloperonospora arabidopsidis (strain Emoy2) TaxID=559515 RepID=M4B8W7_HYAAE